MNSYSAAVAKPHDRQGSFDLFAPRSDRVVAPKTPLPPDDDAPPFVPPNEQLAEPPAGPTPAADKSLSVSQLNDRAAQLLESALGRVYVEGEVSGFSPHRSGHWYFTLKDQNAQVSCCCFKGSQRWITAPPKDGARVIVRGKLTVYGPRGSYQLVIEHMKQAGAGDLLQQLEALKQKLRAEGLFAPERKRALPPLVRCVGVITSPDGAAVRDFIRVAQARDPGLRIVVIPSAVQGAASATPLAQAIRYVSEHHARLGVEVLVVARGGGAIEDLWGFNDEAVARALAACPIPTVSGVGHEVDHTLADLVVDERAPTPTAAAQLVAADMRAVALDFQRRQRELARALKVLLGDRKRRLQALELRLEDPVRQVARAKQQLDLALQDMERALRRRVLLARERVGRVQLVLEGAHPSRRLALHRARLDAVHARLQRSIERLVEQRRARLGQAAGRLDALSPLGVLSRGYAIARRADGRVVRAAAEAPPGTLLTIRLHEGQITARSIAGEEDV